MASMRFVTPLLATLSSITSLASAAGLADIDHVVLFMQENRAFDHYFGTMSGVRGFADPNIAYNGNKPVWKQVTNSDLTNKTDYMTPWYLNYLGGDWDEATQCMSAGDNGWDSNHLALNGGSNDHWAVNNTPFSIGYYQNKDLPVHFSLAEEWIVGDMYQESAIASTNPNRVTWVSGSINVPRSPQNKNEGGYPYIDNNETPGCEDGINCYPLKWKTTAEYYEDAGVSWQVYQDADNFDDNPFAWFKQFQKAKDGTDLNKKGMEGLSLDTFYEQAANGTLPAISFIIGPSELSEHPPYSPHDGAWLERKIAETVITSPKYNKTALIISFDETGGWADHVIPYHSPSGTPGEWIQDPYGDSGYTFSGPGFRLPFYIISPWTRKGGVYGEHCDHNSQIMFLEKWQEAKGKDVKTEEMVPWRREHMANLVNAFDFENPDFSVPDLPEAKHPHTDSSGDYDGASYCASLYGDGRPPVPYKDESLDKIQALAEPGFKQVRGVLTEGRTLVIEADDVAWTVPNKSCSGSRLRLSKTTEDHDSEQQGWVIHVKKIGEPHFVISSAANGMYVCDGWRLCKGEDAATVLKSGFEPSKGHYFKVKGTGEFVAVGKDGRLSSEKKTAYWQVFSVTY